MKLISRPQEGLGTFFGTMRKIKIIYGAYSALGGGRKESNNTSTKKAKVQTCKAEMLSWSNPPNICLPSNFSIIFETKSAIKYSFPYQILSITDRIMHGEGCMQSKASSQLHPIHASLMILKQYSLED